ncbi:MAG: GNAT family protein [Pseudomonadota bacterium]
MPHFDPVTLTGRHVILRPLSPEDAPALREAVAEGDLYKKWSTTIPAPNEVEDDIARRLDWQAQGHVLAFSQTALDGTMLGQTTYLNIDFSVPRLEIGNTYLRASAQRSPVNTEAKRLLLGHAFETLGVAAIDLRTHRLNAQSRRAIERLGAQLDGILRNHKRMPDGTLRDTATYSILASEWDTVRAHLDHQLSR